ncbi:zinc ribbon domain-containing protein [Ignavibacterium album]|uniref:zinc ribbon domain-containing protein n=1 Tax=Ignavibacterium album TaxID=591197 RepID=UPI0035B886CA
MAQINCPQCKQEILDNDKFCANCGYQLINSNVPLKVVEKRTPVFQIIAFVTFFISLSTPMLFLSFFVLVVIVSSIISLVRKEKRWGLSLLALFLGLFLLLAPAINEFQEISYKEKVSIVNWNWEQERNYSYVRGRVRNDGDKIVRYFKIKAFYLDNFGNVLDTDIDNDLDDLYPGMSKEFQIMHKNNPEYKRVSLIVEEVRIK